MSGGNVSVILRKKLSKKSLFYHSCYVMNQRFIFIVCGIVVVCMIVIINIRLSTKVFQATNTNIQYPNVTFGFLESKRPEQQLQPPVNDTERYYDDSTLKLHLQNILKGKNEIWKDSLVLKPYLESSNVMTLSNTNSYIHDPSLEHNNTTTTSMNSQRNVAHLLFGNTIERMSRASRLTEFLAIPFVDNTLRIYLDDPILIDQLNKSTKVFQFNMHDEKRLRDIYKNDYDRMVTRYEAMVYNALKVYCKKVNEDNNMNNNTSNDNDDDDADDGEDEPIAESNVTDANVNEDKKYNTSNTSFNDNDDYENSVEHNVTEASTNDRSNTDESSNETGYDIRNNAPADAENLSNESALTISHVNDDSTRNNTENSVITTSPIGHDGAEDSMTAANKPVTPEQDTVPKVERITDYNDRNEIDLPYRRRRGRDRLDENDFIKLSKLDNVTIDRRIFYFLHIHKAAGTSFCEAAQKNKMLVNKRKNCNVQLDQRCCGYSDTLLAQQEFAKTTSYNFVANEQDMYTAMDTEHYRYILILRNSYSRYKSHYKHTIKRPYGLGPRHSRKPFYNDTFVSWWKGQPDNWNVRKICGTACQHVPKYSLSYEHFLFTLSRLLLFDDIIFVENFTNSFTTFAHKVGWEYMPIHRKVNNKDDPYDALLAKRSLFRGRHPMEQRHRQLQDPWVHSDSNKGYMDGSDTQLEKHWFETTNSTKRNLHHRRLRYRVPRSPDDNIPHHGSLHQLDDKRQDEIDKKGWDFMMSSLDDALYEYALAKYRNNENIETYQLSQASYQRISQYFLDGPKRNCTVPCCAIECTMY
jgi:hypothetical protein